MKSLNETMRKCYNDLAKREKLLKTELQKDYLAHSQDITNTVVSAYQFADSKDGISYAKMEAKVSPVSTVQIQREMSQVESLFPEYEIFKDFDMYNLTRMDIAKIQFLCGELRTASITRDKFNKHLRGYIGRCCDYYYQDFKDVIDEPDKQLIIPVVMIDPKYPINDTIYSQAVECANRESEMLKNHMIRNLALVGTLGAISVITLYARRKLMTNLELLSTSQGTRATVDTVSEVFKKNDESGNVVTGTTKKKEKPYVKSFYSVIADYLACELCQEIAVEQEMHPLPFSMMRPWDTAPPFHPRCRCGIEVIWSNDTDNEK